MTLRAIFYVLRRGAVGGSGSSALDRKVHSPVAGAAAMVSR